MNIETLNTIDRKDLQFAETILAGVSSHMDYTFSFDCSIERLVITFPIGCNGELQLHPYIIRPDGGVDELIKFIGNQYVVGNNQVKPYNPAKSVERGSVLRLDYNNTGVVSHYFDMDVSLDKLYGKVRIDAGKGVLRRG